MEWLNKAYRGLSRLWLSVLTDLMLSALRGALKAEKQRPSPLKEFKAWQE